MTRLFCFGLGFTGQATARRLAARAIAVAGTCRDEAKARRLREAGLEVHLFSGEAAMADGRSALAGTSHLLASIAAGPGGDPALIHHERDIEALGPGLRRIIYLSTTVVYGDHGGAWIDEDTPVRPLSERARRRVAAEQAWRELGRRVGVPVDIFRLSGIYGPGRSQLDALREGRARRIVKPGQVFNRIHVDDIASAIELAIESDLPGAVYNLADDEPAPPQDVIAYAAGLLGVAPPPEVAFEDAEMTAMARSFYSESKRVANRRVKQRLGLELAYPTYREGLAAIAAAEAAEPA